MNVMISRKIATLSRCPRFGLPSARTKTISLPMSVVRQYVENKNKKEHSKTDLDHLIELFRVSTCKRCPFLPYAHGQLLL